MIYGEILAGGSGSRMGNTDMPKQFLMLGEKPIIIHTIEQFLINPKFNKILVLCPKEWMSYAKDLLSKYELDMDRIEIVVCVDKWFVMPTGVMMYSVCMNNPNVDIRFHVIADDSVPELGKDDLREMVEKFSGKEIVFYDIDITRFPSFPKVSVNLTQASYYRLLLSEILSKELHKVLYLDGDMIVRHSLLPLWTVDLNFEP